MQPNSNTKSRADAQTAIVAIAITATLAFWNLFASLDSQKKAEAAVNEARNQSVVAEVAPTQMTAMPNVKILLGGAAPQPPTVIVQKKSPKNDSVAQTGSS